MIQLSPNHIELLARYHIAIDEEIARKERPAFKCFNYDSRDLRSLENDLIKRLTETSSKGKIYTLEAALNEVSTGHRDGVHKAFDYMALTKLLSFDEYYLVEREGVLLGALRTRDGCRMNSDDVFKSVDVSSRLKGALKEPLLRIEWAYLQALCFVGNRRYTEEHLSRCPLKLLYKIRELLTHFKKHFDARRIVPIRYKAISGGQEYKWTGRGVMPRFWKEMFERYGESRFEVKGVSFDPIIDGGQ